MINIKCPNKNQAFVGFFLCKNAGQKKLHSKFLAFFKHFFPFFKQIKKNWVKNLQLQFFICLHFIGVGGDENLKSYLTLPLKLHSL